MRPPTLALAGSEETSMTSESPADKLMAALRECLAEAGAPTVVTVTATVTSTGWTPERLWDAPAATRLDARDLAASLGVTPAAVYKWVKRDGMPARRRPDSSLVFLAGDVRTWLEERETVVNRFVPKIMRRVG
jgi:predicted DNA-binding transcriptional regulator AlpA